jgi:hypothetical protein
MQNMLAKETSSSWWTPARMRLVGMAGIAGGIVWITMVATIVTLLGFDTLYFGSGTADTVAIAAVAISHSLIYALMLIALLAADARYGADYGRLGRAVGARLSAEGSRTGRGAACHQGGRQRRGYLRPRHRQEGDGPVLSRETTSSPGFPRADRARAGNTPALAGGHGNAEISSELFLSLKTVQNHVSNIFRKLQVADRAQAVIRAREAGLGDGP